MKRILSIGVVAVSFLAFVGCEDLPGVLVVTKDFNVLVKGKSKTIVSGSHKTALDFKKNKVIAAVETSDGTLKIEIVVPQDSQIPSNGNFELQSAQSGQPFDVLGAVQTTVTEGSDQSGYESCQRQDYDTVCDQHGCHVVPVIRQGSRQIGFYLRETHQKMQFDMTAVGAAKNKYANFQGEAHMTEKIVTREGPCF